ncbi:MAG: 4-(cytidine 5'-diphospho)-2-C-methyl-D-erythritol kinase [Caulobacteraceae bacterium]
MNLEEFAPAKVNLYLHVGPVGLDGYHPVNSLMVFADVGDRVRLTSAPGMSFAVEGAFAEGLAHDGDNLVTHARDRFLEAGGTGMDPFDLVLDKALPVAAGLGGGSADAAATLRLLSRTAAASGSPAPSAERVDQIARGLGSDVAACMSRIPVIAEGRGDRLTPAPRMPELHAVLVNPGAPSSTANVYRAYDRAAAMATADSPAYPAAFASAEELVGFLKACRNDLETPAIGLQPRIGDVLAVLARSPEALLTRMSGSGATCFALCAGRSAAEGLARDVARDHGDWWVTACRLASTDRPSP